MPPTVCSLFSGCGGKDLGFQRAGFKLVWANDIDKSACDTYRLNIGDHIHHADISHVSSSDIPCCDVVIGGFPCQGFSIVGTRRLDDERNFLYRELKRVIRDTRPSFFVAENVRGLLNINGGKVIAAMLTEFEDLGYDVDYRLLNARDFGSPQHRERVIIVGNRLGLKNPFPLPTYGESDSLLPFADFDMKPYRTLRDAIGDITELGDYLPNHEIRTDWIEKHPEFLKIMENIGEGQKLCNVRLGSRSVCTWDIPEVFGRTNKREREILLAIAGNRRKKIYGNKDGNPLPTEVIQSLVGGRDVTEDLERLVTKEYLIKFADGFELKNAFNGIFRRLRWNQPSEAVLTVFDSPRFYVHPAANRPFSVRELARVQDFPDEFTFCGRIKDQYRQIGNAVPVLLSQAVAASVYECLTKNRKRCELTAS